jgi:hypothetical protein
MYTYVYKDPDGNDIYICIGIEQGVLILKHGVAKNDIYKALDKQFTGT